MKLNSMRPGRVLSVVSALALALGVSASAGASQVVKVNTVPLGGSNTFNTDEITFTTLGLTTVTVTDSDGNGVLDASFGDTFVETGIISAVNFQLSNINIPVATSGIGLNYEMYAVFTPPDGGPLVGAAGIVAGTTAAAFFKPPTNAKIFYDTVVNGTFDIGSSTAIAKLTLDPDLISNCELPNFGASQGSCVINWRFDAAGVTAPGVWTVAGIDLGDYTPALMRTDVNVDKLASPFTVVYPDGPGSTQVREVDQDGSGTFAIPEPASLSLIALGLLGSGMFGRRRQR